MSEGSEAARTWEDRFEAAVRASGRGPEDVAATLARHRHAFPAGYRDRFSPQEALEDLATIEAIRPGERIRVRAYRSGEDGSLQFRFKLYRPTAPAALADVLPILDNMGLKALAEAGFPISRTGLPTVWVHDFEIEDPRGAWLIHAGLR